MTGKKRRTGRGSSSDGGHAEDGKDRGDRPPSPAAPAQHLPSLAPLQEALPTADTALAKKPAKPKPVPATSSVLAICRNKHWKYISSFHGPWLSLPIEALEAIAHANYNTPRPRPVDPGVFFDLLKIRKLVDEAANLAVRAAAGVASLGQWGLTGTAAQQAAALGVNYGQRPPPHAKLSPERKQKIREQATQKLVEAYGLDEIAASVATMQSASALEDVAALVLQRNPKDVDAKYIHFFHEKIPSRQLAESTTLAPLDTIIAARPSDPAPLRTRAMIRVFKADYQGAADDLTAALQCYRLYHRIHPSPRPPQHQEGQLLEKRQHGSGRKQPDVILKEADQPSSLEQQLLFQRAAIYLGIACSKVIEALPPLSDAGRETEPPQQPKAPSEKTDQEQRHMAEAKKLVRLNAKRALRDYMAYFAHFEYSPDLPIEIAEDFVRKVNFAANGARAPRSQSHASAGDGAVASHRVYTLSDLFASSPPPGLPPYPITELVPASCLPQSSSEPLRTTTESLTSHPLLTDGLHGFLLCHCLIQTPPKELRRHAYMAARLARLSDGYPAFHASRCPARTDWIDILRATGDWLQLSGPWEELCAPTPLPLFQSAGVGTTPIPVSLLALKQPAPGSDGATPNPVSAVELGEQSKTNTRQRTLLDNLVTDEPAVRNAFLARQRRAQHDYQVDTTFHDLDATAVRTISDELEDEAAMTTDSLPPGGARTMVATVETTRSLPAACDSSGNGTSNSGKAGAGARYSVARSACSDEPKDLVILSDRATAVARWITDVPRPSTASTGGEGLRKRRKRFAKRGSHARGSSTTVCEGDEGPDEGEGGCEGKDEGEG